MKAWWLELHTPTQRVGERVHLMLLPSVCGPVSLTFRFGLTCAAGCLPPLSPICDWSSPIWFIISMACCCICIWMRRFGSGGGGAPLSTLWKSSYLAHATDTQRTRRHKQAQAGASKAPSWKLDEVRGRFARLLGTTQIPWEDLGVFHRHWQPLLVVSVVSDSVRSPELAHMVCIYRDLCTCTKRG